MYVPAKVEEEDEQKKKDRAARFGTQYEAPDQTGLKNAGGNCFRTTDVEVPTCLPHKFMTATCTPNAVQCMPEELKNDIGF